MSHGDFVRPSGVWAPEFVPGASDYYRWDVSQSRVLNGDTGGSWAPTKPIMIGGAGAQFNSPGTVWSGGVRTQSGGTIVLGAYDQVALSPTRSRRIMMDFIGTNPQLIGASVGPFPRDVYLPIVAPGGSPAAGLNPSSFGESLTIPIPSRYLHHAAVLSSVELNFRVIQRPEGLPLVPIALFVAPEMGANGPGAPISFTGQSLSGLLSWQPSFSYATTNHTYPVLNTSLPMSWFRCTTPGISGPTEPTWRSIPGVTTIDGTVGWTCIGPTGWGFASNYGNATVDQYWNEGNPQTLVAAFDPTSPAIDRSGHYYTVTLLNVPTDGSILLHSVVFEFDNITQMFWP